MYLMKNILFVNSVRNLSSNTFKHKVHIFQSCSNFLVQKYIHQLPPIVLRYINMSRNLSPENRSNKDLFFIDTLSAPILIDIDDPMKCIEQRIKKIKHNKHKKYIIKEKCDDDVHCSASKETHKSILKKVKKKKSDTHKSERLKKQKIKIKKLKSTYKSYNEKLNINESKAVSSEMTENEEDIIYEGTFSQNYIPLNYVCRKNFFREHLIETSKMTNSHKRHSSSSSKNHHTKVCKSTPNSDCLSNRPNENNNVNVHGNRQSILSMDSDDDIIIEREVTYNAEAKEDPISDIKKKGDIIQSSVEVEEGEILSSEDSREDIIEQITAKKLSTDIFESGLEEEEVQSSEDSFKSDSNETCNSPISIYSVLSRNLEEDEGFKTEDINENVDMDIETDSDCGSDISIDVNDPNFIPLDNFKLSNIQTNIPISDAIKERRSKLESMRRWELTGLGQEMISNSKNVDGVMFTVLSYNVLAQQLITDNMFLYKDCDSKALEWEYRWPLLQHEIRHLQPDIMTFQEVQSSHYHTFYLPWFSYLGYKSIFKKRTGDKVDGCAIIYNEKKFNLIEETSVEYNQPKAGSILNRDNVGLIVKLTPSAFYSPFCVATTHILFNPRRVDVKLAQFTLLLTELDRICYEAEEGGRPIYCPVILSGDFNTEPYSRLMSLIRRGILQYAGMCKTTLKDSFYRGSIFGSELISPTLGLSDYCQHKVLSGGRYLDKLRGNIFSLSDKRKIEENIIKLSHTKRKDNSIGQSSSSMLLDGSSVSSGTLHHAFNFKSVYYHKLRRLHGEPEATTFHNSWKTVDYIYYTRVLNNSNMSVEGSLKLIGRYGLLSAREAERLGPLPSEICPSDHYPLAAQFLLKDSKNKKSL